MLDKQPESFPASANIDALTLTFLTDRAEQIRVLGKQVKDGVIEIGRLLAECKERCGHGNWLPWLEAEFGWSDRHAQLHVRVRAVDQIGKLFQFGPAGLKPLPALCSVDTRIRPQGGQHPCRTGERLRHAEVQAIISGHSPAAVREAFRQIRAEKIATRHAEWTAKAIELSKQNAPLPCNRKYPVILADPPWKFEVYDPETAERTPDTHYPTLSIDEICALPVADLATADAALFLWCTSPHLPDALDVIEAWGFTYRSQIVWVKTGCPPGLGRWVRNQHEILLIAARGDMRAPLESNRPPSVIHAPRREHSRKPDEAHEVIERMYPDLPKIELFARHARPGWDAWGNEATVTAPASRDGLDISAPLRRRRA